VGAGGQPAGRVPGSPTRSPRAIRQGLADWPETVETNHAARTCPRSGTVNLKRRWLQRDSNPCMIPAQEPMLSRSARARRFAAGEAPGEPWHTSFATSSRRSASEA
jgi:hypothetical protein